MGAGSKGTTTTTTLACAIGHAIITWRIVTSGVVAPDERIERRIGWPILIHGAGGMRARLQRCISYRHRTAAVLVAWRPVGVG